MQCQHDEELKTTATYPIHNVTKGGQQSSCLIIRRVWFLNCGKYIFELTFSFFVNSIVFHKMWARCSEANSEMHEG